MKTLVIGASTNPERYSYKAIYALKNHGYEVIPLGIKNGTVAEIDIYTQNNPFENIDTVTLYISPKIQPQYYDYIINTIHPRRIIFNPGTENNEFVQKAKDKGILCEIACTLVLLSTNQY